MAKPKFTTKRYYYSKYEPTSVYVCRGVLADALRVDKFFHLRNSPDDDLKIVEYTTYSDDPQVPDEIYPVYQNGRLKNLISFRPETDTSKITQEPLFVVKQEYTNAKPNEKHLVNIYDNDRGYACRINTNPAERGRLAEGKVYFMDDDWKDEARIGVAEVYITSEFDGYGYVMGENIRMEFPTKDDLLAVKAKNPNAYLRRVQSIDPESMGDICYNSNTNMILFRAKELFEVETHRFISLYIPSDKQDEMKIAISNSIQINMDDL